MMADRLVPEWAVRSLIEPLAIRTLTSPFLPDALTEAEAETVVRSVSTEALLDAFNEGDTP